MTAVPPGGHQPKEPIGPKPSTPATPSSDSRDAFLLQSPFAKMFKATGQMPTVKEMKAIMDGILKTVVDQAKKDDVRWKKAMQKLKEQLEGRDN